MPGVELEWVPPIGMTNGSVLMKPHFTMPTEIVAAESGRGECLTTHVIGGSIRCSRMVNPDYRKGLNHPGTPTPTCASRAALTAGDRPSVASAGASRAAASE